MDWGKVKFFLGEVLANFTRNGAMQLTAIGTVTVTIVMLGAFLFARETIGNVGKQILDQIAISVYLKDDASDAAARALRDRIARDRRVTSAVYVPKAEGLRQMRQRLAGQIDTSLLTSNPLPNAFRVRVADANDVHAVADRIKALPGVASVNYEQDAVRKLLVVSDVLAKIGLGIITLLVLTAAIIISNTIRLTVFARRREIAIMQLVGATNAYIRGPFICEGMLAGLLGAAIAVGLLAVARGQLIPKLVISLPFVPFGRAPVNEFQLALELLLVGALVGVVASWVSVGRYLRT